MEKIKFVGTPDNFAIIESFLNNIPEENGARSDAFKAAYWMWNLACEVAEKEKQCSEVLD